MKYEPYLDGIRAISIILVMSNHIPGFPYFVVGSVGVDIFFPLSGWLITNLLISEKAKFGSIMILPFYIRRAFRIMPLYFLTIILYAISAYTYDHLSGDSAKWIRFMNGFPFFASFNMDLMPENINSVFGHAWTLSIEEKFYIIWPLMFAVLIRHSAIAALATLLIAFIPIFYLGNLMVIRGYVELSCACVIAMAISSNSNVWELAVRKARYLLPLIAIILYSASIFVKSDVILILFGLSSLSIIISLHFGNNDVLKRFFSNKLLVYLGKLTFCVYLIHVLVIDSVLVILRKFSVESPVVVILVSYFLSCVVASGLRIVLEAPMIEVGRRIASDLRFRSSTLKRPSETV